MIPLSAGMIESVETRLKNLNGIEHPWSARDFIIPTDDQNALLISENQDEASLAICLKKEVLESLGDRRFPRDFDFDIHSSLSILVEELSHFNFYCVNAHHGRSISNLDMEVQAEVDKFAFALDCLNEQNQAHLQDQLFDLHFGELKLGNWVKEEEVERYEAAHEIARAFCRKLMRHENLPADLLKEFFKLSVEERFNFK